MGEDERPGAPDPDAPLDDLLKWAGQDGAAPPPSPAAARPAAAQPAPRPARADDDVLAELARRDREERAPEKRGRGGIPVIWAIVLGGVGIWLVVHVISGLLVTLGFVALAVAVVAGVLAVLGRGWRR